jgi:hypothetical protein
MSSAKPITDHEEIRKWVEERGGKPARVRRTGKGDDPGILRIDFPGYSGEDTLEAISWEDWFQAFEDNGLALIKQDRTGDGALSRFNKLVARETVERREHGEHHASVHEKRGDKRAER